MRSLGLAVALAALALTAAPALAADPLPVTDALPAGRVAMAPMTDLSFSAKIEVPVETAFVRVSTAAPGPDGQLMGQVAGGQMTRQPFGERMAWHLPAISSLRMRPGAYWWQVVGLVRTASGAMQELTSPPQRVELYFPSSWTRRAPIDRRFGRRGHARFLLSSRGIPQGVDPARLRTVVAVAARRWGLRLTGWTDRVAGARDHVNVAGFGPVPVAGALAVQADLYQRRYRVFRRCAERRRAGVVVQRTCGPLERQYLGKVRTDQDLIIRPDVSWAMGPARPPLDEFDLESVVVHELGHMAGNKKHTPRCSNGPMGPALAPGEWWRTPHDRYRRGCPLSAPRGVL
jgi:hypothetical protein